VLPVEGGFSDGIGRHLSGINKCVVLAFSSSTQTHNVFDISTDDIGCFALSMQIYGNGSQKILSFTTIFLFLIESCKVN